MGVGGRVLVRITRVVGHKGGLTPSTTYLPDPQKASGLKFLFGRESKGYTVNIEEYFQEPSRLK